MPDGLGPGGLPDIYQHWATKDIVYLSLMTIPLVMAFLEWFLFILAFNYCLWCTFRKAPDWTTKVMSVLMVIIFTAFRGVFLPVMVFTLPLPARITQYYPQHAVVILQWFSFYAFAALLTVPWLLCVFQLVTSEVGRKKKITHTLDEFSAPKVVIVMPCYREKPEILLRTIDSIVDCEYPPSCMHVFLSFDGDDEGELYLNTIGQLGVPLTLKTYPKSIDVVYRNSRITVSRFPHGGKRNCQKMTFKLIDTVYAEYLKRNDNLFILFIDSDCILDKVCIQNFMYDMELKPGNKHPMLAMTGVITSTTEKNTLLTILQDMEYVHGQLFERTVESAAGAVTCLPGALTLLRFSAFRKLSKEYFKDRSGQIEDIFDYGKTHLGEDRYLTHLFMIAAKHRYQIAMNPSAFCKTEAVEDFKTLLKQRRRWFIGFITNEVCMLTDIRLWRQYPLLEMMRLANNTIRTTALLFFILVLSLLTTTQKVQNLPYGFIAVSLGLNWLMMLYFSLKLGRNKLMFYPLMFLLNPLFNWCYMIYGIFTAGQRTWGGPRADAAKADPATSPHEAIETAEANGDDLNIAPDTFKTEIVRRKSLKGETYESMPLQPGSEFEGQFTEARPLPGGWYEHESDSSLGLPDSFGRDPNTRRMHLHPRPSEDSSESSPAGSIYMPRRIESFLTSGGVEEYHENQMAIEKAKPAGGEAFLAKQPLPADYHRPTKPEFKVGVSSSSSSVSSSASSTSPKKAESIKSRVQTQKPTGLKAPPTAYSRKSNDRPRTPKESKGAAMRSPLGTTSFYATSDEELTALPLTAMDARTPDIVDTVHGQGTPTSYFPSQSAEADEQGIGASTAAQPDESKKHRRRLTKEKWNHPDKR